MASLTYTLQVLGVVLGTAAVTSLVSQRFGQPPIFGYLLAGVLLGPHMPWQMIAGPGGEALTHAMSEFGVILLMFGIGIEFNLRKIARIGPSTGMTALFVVGLMVSGGYLVGRAFAWTRVESLFIGGCVAISSTMFVAKAFEDQHLGGEFTTVTVAILVFEDLIAILLLSVLTALAAGAGLSATQFALTLGKLLGFLVLLLTAGLLVVPRFVRRIIGQYRAESTLIAGIAICFITTALTSAAGYSVALGGFMAGLLVAESGEGARVEHVVRPLRDIFGALFFIAVGMSIDPSRLVAHWLPVLALTALVLVGKVASVSLGAVLFGHGLQTSVRAAMSLAQIGEFSFIIAGLGIASGVTREFIFPVVVGVSLLTSVITPWMVRRSQDAAAALEARLPVRLRLLLAIYVAWTQRLWSAPPVFTARGRLARDALFLVVDAVLLVAVLAGSSRGRDALEALVSRRLALPATLVSVVWIAATLLFAGLFFVGVLRRSAALARTLTDDTVRHHEPDAPEDRRAPWSALTVMIELAVLFIVGVPLVIVSQPFVPFRSGVLVLVLVVAVLAHKVWQGITTLEEHTHAGAELIVQVLARQGREPVEVAEPPQPAPDLPGLGRIRLEAGSIVARNGLDPFDIASRSGARVVAIEREGVGALLPAPRQPLEPADVLVLLGPEAALAAARIILHADPKP
ncbi:cation:proton antiporter domain-containing protein [Nannocystis bainbridge]|uniref:Cation:proton antiporter n=1 Tax=Nannocystis bainbridge TaxID=2995303 RepID=A0ABT5DSM8_9BACT|nr:cation:proton antiporter [Nannocystis bainbridge]MDC0716650.1 cation:proton antiporter [Nannocystis bainbridge]